MLKLRRVLSVFLCFSVAVFGCGLLSACGQTAEEKETYTITYHLNYEGAPASRAVSVAAGGKAVSWRPHREGFEIGGWYTDPQCIEGTEYDFEQGTYADASLYAGWKAEKGNCIVTFDPNYEGAPYPGQISVEEGSLLSEEDLPELTRLGMELEGWYADAACTDAWDIETDAVNEDTRLYAKFAFDGSIERDENGEPVFENVTVNLWIGTDFDSAALLEGLAGRFNRDPAYAGKIYLNVTRTIDNQDLISLRYQQTPEKNRLNNTYYPVADIYNMAGISASPEKWYAGASQDSFVEGQLYSVPFLGSAPFLIYNKALMAKYNGDAELPDTYSEFSALMKRAYEGEIGSKPGFHSIRSNRSWTYNEATSYAAFFQNDAEYYTFENGRYVSKWSDEQVFGNAVTALTNTFNVLSDNGELHGISTGNDSEYTDDAALNDVVNGNALFGLINWSLTLSKIAQRTATVGVMPLSGLFADADKVNKDSIPLHTQTLAFYRAKRLTNTELAAAAVVAEYLCANSYEFAIKGRYPLTKAAVENEKFSQPATAVGKLLLQTGDPENFRTVYGNKNGKDLVNSKLAGRLLPRVLNGDGSNITATAEQIKYTIRTEINR